MPITTQDKEKLQIALAAFDTVDSVAIARLLYETLLDAKNQGLGVNAIWSLGKLIYDKSPWEVIAQVEDAIGKQSIRMPLIKSTDTVFRALLSSRPPKLSQEDRASLQVVLDKLDATELISLTSLVYATLCQAELAVAEKEFAGMHPFTKFLISGWTWEDMTSVEPLVRGICIPLVNTCHGFLRETLPEIIRIEDPAAAEEPLAAREEKSIPSPEEIIAASEAVTTQTETDDMAQETSQETSEEGGVSDLEPFVQKPASEASPPEQEAASPQAKTPTSAAPDGMPVPTNTPSNGHRLSKKERRELRRRQREAQVASSIAKEQDNQPAQPKQEVQDNTNNTSEAPANITDRDRP